MAITHVDDLLKLPNSDLAHVSGTLSKPVSLVSTPEKLKTDSLVFVSTKEQWELVSGKQVAVVISLESAVPKSLDTTACVLTTKNIKKTMTGVLELFDQSQSMFQIGVHPSAVVSSDCQIGKNVSIGAFTYIGKGVKIGDRAKIGPNSVIEDNATIGSHSVLHAHVFVGYNCIVGNHCDIQAQTTIGSDGFGYFTDNTYTHSKVPQIGNVVVGDNVEMGASCCIDRATIDSTVIGSGTKLDNLCHIAHNCTVGENSMIAAGFFVAGSSHLGKRFTTGGNTVVSTQLQVADGVTLAGRSTVTNNILESGQYGGYPLQPLKDFLKTVSTVGNIVDMRKKINQIMKHLSLKE